MPQCRDELQDTKYHVDIFNVCMFHWETRLVLILFAGFPDAKSNTSFVDIHVQRGACTQRQASGRTAQSVRGVQVCIKRHEHLLYA